MAQLQQQWDDSATSFTTSSHRSPRKLVSVTISLTLVVVAVASEGLFAF
jgi:hypothetical protein